MNIWYKLVLMALIISMLSACVVWEKNVIRNGIHFSKLKVPESGVISGVLAEDAMIQDFPCKKGYVWFYGNWDLEEVRLSEPYDFNGLLLPEGTWIRLYRSGSIHICFLPHDLEVEGYLCKGSILQREGNMTTFHENGRLKFFCSRGNADINGFRFKGCIYLDDEGSLAKGKLAEDSVINGRNYKKNTILKMDNYGEVINLEKNKEQN